MNREQVQNEALNTLKLFSGIGSLIMDTGVGKSKVAIDFIIDDPNIQTVLITSPRENLKANWYNEIILWSNSVGIFAESDLEPNTIPFMMGDKIVLVTFENIQTCYRWENRHFDMVIADEVHCCMTSEYSRIFLNNDFTYKVGLTATSDIKGKPEKLELYNLYCPIIYTFLTAEEYGVVNKTKIIVVDHILNNVHKIHIKTKKHDFFLGEQERYSYICKEFRRGQSLMASTGSTNYFEDADYWFWKGNGTPNQKEAARVYLKAVQNRKYFLLRLTSTKQIAIKLSEQLTQVNGNKVLVFSELTEQIDSICTHTVHSKHKNDINAQTLQRFNDGDIKVLGSCYSLTLGLNMKAVNIAIFESYLSSFTKAKQRRGRLNRLIADEEIATLYIIRLPNTQAETWFNGFVDKDEISEVIKSEDILKE